MNMRVSKKLEGKTLIALRRSIDAYTEVKVDVTQEIEQIRVRNGLHQIGQPVAPSVLFPVLHPL